MTDKQDFVISGIEWDNITLHINVRCGTDDDALFYFAVREDDEAPILSQNHIIRDVVKEDGGYLISINVSQAVGRSFMENGEWILMAVDGADTYRLLVDPSCAYRFQDLSRVFRYEHGKAYVITFDGVSCEDNKALLFVMNSTFMKTNDKWRDRREGAKGTVLSGLKASAGKAPRRQRKHILFMTETSDVIKGNLKAVYDQAMKRHLDDEADITVYARADADKGLGASGLLKLRKLIASQDVIILDDYAPVFSYIDPPKGARLIQLWHAAEGFKSVGYSRFGKAGSPHPEWSCHRKYTDAFVAHEDLIDVYSEVFGIEKSAFKVTGMPRLDGFTSPERMRSARDKIFSIWPEIKDKRLILFAPTFRGNGQKDAYYDYDKLDLERIAEACGPGTIFAVKMHPFIEEKIEIPEDLKGRVVDLSEYPEINDLYYVADVLITDYSSDFFEFALLRKPVLFYTYDRDIYQITRGVHRDVRETAPGKVCDTLDELISSIRNNDYDFGKTEQFCDRYRDMLTRHAADDIIDRIIGTEEE